MHNDSGASEAYAQLENKRMQPTETGTTPGPGGTAMRLATLTPPRAP